MITQTQLDTAIEQTYLYAHNFCHYAPTDQSFPVGEDGRMDCTGIILRSLWWLDLIHEPLNCDQIDAMMGQLGFIKSTDPEDIYRYHGFVQWCEPHNVGTGHINHTYYSLGGDGQTISKYDFGSETRLRTIQPYVGVPTDEWYGKYIFSHMWILPDMPHKLDEGIYIEVGD